MKTKLNLACILFTITLLLSNIVIAQDNRKWWKALPPAWKKTFQNAKLNGQTKEPTDEQLNAIVNIDSLNCSGNTGITNLQALENLKFLKYLNLSGCTGLTSVQGIEVCSHLLTLICTDNDNLLNLFPISKLPTLEKLDFSNTMVNSLAPIQTLANLRELICTKTPVQYLDPIRTLSKLQVIDFNGDVLVHDITPLIGLKSLLILNLNGTKVEDLKPLQKLPQLEQIFIANTKVKTLISLEVLKNLKVIDCSDTEVKSISYILDHKKIEDLKCNRTYITVEEIDDFKKKHKDCKVEWEMRIK